MNVIGQDLQNALALRSKLPKESINRNKSSFKHTLRTVKILGAAGTRQTKHTAAKAGVDSKANLLSFLKTTDLLQLDGGKELQNQLNANPSDILTLVKDYLGISEQKWSEILNQSGQDSQKMQVNENTILALKAAKLFTLLTAYKGAGGKQANLTQLFHTPAMQKFSGKMKNVKEDSPSEAITSQDLLSLIIANLQQINGWKEWQNQIQTDPKDDLLQLGFSSQQWSAIINDFTGTVAPAQKNDAQALSNPNMMQNSLADLLQSLKKELRITDQRWSAIFNDYARTVKQAQTNDTRALSNPNMMQNSLADLLQSLKKVLGISDQRWGEMIDQLNGNTQNNHLFPLSKGNESDLQFLEWIKEKNSGINQGDQSNGKQSDLQNQFARVINDKNQTAETAPKEKQIKVDASVIGGNSFSFHTLTKPEQLSIMLNGAQKNTSASDILQQFESILAKSHFSKMNGVQKLSIKLSPENLGTLSIEIIQKDHTLVAKILASSKTAKDLLESQLNGLKSSFAAQNIQVDKVEIGMQSAQSSQEQFSNRHQQNHQEQGNDPPGQESEQNSEETNNNFTLSLEEALFNMEA